MVAGVLWASGLRVTWAPLLGMLAVLASLAGGHHHYLKRGESGLASVIGGLAIMMGSALMAGLIANAGMRLR